MGRTRGTRAVKGNIKNVRNSHLDFGPVSRQKPLQKQEDGVEKGVEGGLTAGFQVVKISGQTFVTHQLHARAGW